VEDDIRPDDDGRPVPSSEEAFLLSQGDESEGPAVRGGEHADLLARVEAMDLSPPEKAVAFRRGLWLKQARPQQLRPKDLPGILVLLGGRGSGKTRPGAEDTYWNAYQNPGSRWAAVSPTIGACRDVQFLGESGLRAVVPDSALYGGNWGKAFNATRLELTLANQSVIMGFGSVKPERLRGPNFSGYWIDEPGSFADAWRLPFEIDTTFSNLVMASRSKVKGGVKGLITGTPVNCPLLTGDIGLGMPGILNGIEAPPVRIETMSTRDNLSNLDPAFASIVMSLDGTRIGRQEIDAEILTDVEGAKFQGYWFLVDPEGMLPHKRFVQIAVGVDPGGAEGNGGDETGIVVCGLDDNHVYWVLEDLSGRHGVEGWTHLVWDAVKRWAPQSTIPPVVVAERNYGGPMVRHALTTSGEAITGTAIETPNASHGKTVRMSPVALLFEPSVAHPLGTRAKFGQPLPLLVNEATRYTDHSKWSPNRLDAMVWPMLWLTQLDPGPTPSGIATASVSDILAGRRKTTTYR
jgi:phage terminase large subunit-like protein